MPTNCDAGWNPWAALRTSRALRRPNGSRSENERGVESGGPPASCQEMLAREKRTRLMSSTAGLEAIMSAMRWSTTQVGCDGLRFLMRQQTDRRRLRLRGLGGGAGSSVSARAASSSWRCSAPSWSVMNSRLPNWKVWEGGNGGGAHNPLLGIAGKSREPKWIVSPRLAAGAVNGVIETF